MDAAVKNQGEGEGKDAPPEGGTPNEWQSR